MKIWKINKNFKLHIYSNGIVRLFHKYKEKWICIKLSHLDIINLKFTLNSTIE